LSYLHAHARAGVMPPSRPPSSATIMREVRARAEAMLSKRRVHEQRLPPSPPGSQDIVRLEGDALCLTRSFWEGLHHWAPEECSRLRRRIPGETVIAGRLSRFRMAVLPCSRSGGVLCCWVRVGR